MRRALGEWARTNSPVTYWYNKMSPHRAVGSYTNNPGYFDQDTADPGELALFLKIFSELCQICNSHSLIIDHVNFLFGLPEADAKEVCKMFYRENVAKVVVEIVGPDVMRLEKDINTTFTQKLGIIGMVS